MLQNYPVVICGAGPTGLMLAAQLLRFDIDFLIIDKKSGPTNESRAVVVQARSMEIYEQMGLSDDIIAHAQKTDGVCFWRNGKKISETIFRELGSGITPFDFVIMYEQSKNESLLYHHLQKNNKEVEWDTELINFKCEQNKFVVSLKKNDEKFEVTAQYLVACDGGKSTVRDLAGMDFSGGTYENVFYVADTHVHAAVCENKLNFFVANNTFNLLFPMVGEKRFRAIGILPKQYYHHTEIDFDEVSGQVNKDAGMNLGFYDTAWYSTYRLHHKKVKSFRENNIFFCGDAAHVHSPAGGQGMNTGLQDAYNLAWKLALVIQQKAKENLLDTYHEERNPVAENLLKTTDRMFTVMSKNKPLNAFLRMYVVPAILPLLMKIKSFRRKFFLLVSQTKINYCSSLLSSGEAGEIKAGMRFPYFILTINNKKTSVFQLIRMNALDPFLLLYYGMEINDLKSDLFHPVLIEKNEMNDGVLQKAGFPLAFICLLRPDNYIGYISETWDKTGFYQYINHMFVTSSPDND